MNSLAIEKLPKRGVLASHPILYELFYKGRCQKEIIFVPNISLSLVVI